MPITRDILAAFGGDLHPTPRGGSYVRSNVDDFAADADDQLLLEALRTAQAKLVYVSDSEADDKLLRLPGAEGSLWFWDREPRLQALLFETMESLSVQGGDLRYLPADGCSRTVVSLQAPICADAYTAQTKLVFQAIPQRTDREPEILVQRNDLAAFWMAITHIDPAQAVRTAELMDLGMAFATCVVMRLKHALSTPRPIDVSPRLVPDIRTPGHGSLPGGHAAASFFMTSLLASLLGIDLSHAPDEVDNRWRMLFRLAHRVSQSRVVAGLHFPMDNVAGRVIGEALAQHFVARCGGAPSPADRAEVQCHVAARFDGTFMDAGVEQELPRVDPSQVKLNLVEDTLDYPKVLGDMVDRGRPAALESSPLLCEIWNASYLELGKLNLLGHAPQRLP